MVAVIRIELSDGQGGQNMNFLEATRRSPGSSDEGVQVHVTFRSTFSVSTIVQDNVAVQCSAVQFIANVHVCYI